MGIGRIAHFTVIVWASVLCAPFALRAALVSNVGVLGSDTFSGATDINDAGVVVGASFYYPPTSFQPPPVFQGFRWTPAGGIQPIGSFLPGGMSYASGINSAGTIVGWSSTALGNAGAAYVPPGPIQPIANAGEATAINDNGVIVGFVPQSGLTQHAYRYDGIAAPQDLGVIGGTQSFPNDVNNSGTVVGWSNINSSSVKKAFRYVGASGPMQAIPGLSNVVDSEASAINEAGVAVGFVSGGGAFRYTSGGVLQSLPGTGGRAYDIDDAGFVVGTYGAAAQLAALWRPDNTFVDLDQWLNLNDPVEGAKWTLTNGLGINNNGLIVGVGQYSDGPGGLTDGQRGYVLNASSLVPEPASAMALLVPLAGLLVRRRRC
jgi:probable HAF family extracellular repeat protein